jgi:hypothetical protein
VVDYPVPSETPREPPKRHSRATSGLLKGYILNFGLPFPAVPRRAPRNQLGTTIGAPKRNTHSATDVPLTNSVLISTYTLLGLRQTRRSAQT